jgi:hypothetical protein
MEQLNAVGGWVLGLIIAAVLCLLAYPVIRIGWHARTFIRLRRQGYRGAQLKKSLRYAVIGLILVVTLGAVLGFAAPDRWSISYGLAIAFLISLGGFGYKLVPDGLGD